MSHFRNFDNEEIINKFVIKKTLEKEKILNIKRGDTN